jgi:hypothetical protein
MIEDWSFKFKDLKESLKILEDLVMIDHWWQAYELWYLKLQIQWAFY